jgi:hypothetical protein
MFGRERYGSRDLTLEPGCKQDTDSAREYNLGMPKTGRFLGIPYDWRRPSVERLKERWWNREDARVFVPKVFGWGWAINLYELLRRLKLVAPGPIER